jgi:hypothetical protein
MKRDYPIDDNRVLITGFSMGGAAAWHHAVHYTDLFAAASPGAGFAETRIYQNMDNTGEWVNLPDWQKKLHHLYDSTDYAANLSMLPTIAYAGELDKQKQSGDLMEKALAKEGFKLERISGPKTEHKYEPAAKAEIAKRLDAYAQTGRHKFPSPIQFTTYTLRYNRAGWIQVDGLEKHWEPARLEAQPLGSGNYLVKTSNVSALSLLIPAGYNVNGVSIDGSRFVFKAPEERTGARKMSFIKEDRGWETDKGMHFGHRKTHALQGPIDDAFLDPFLIVKPTGPALNDTLRNWTNHELNHAITQWRAIFRGEPRVTNDTALTPDDIANHNLILFGDPSSNATLAKIADKLPIKWTRDYITLNNQTYPSTNHVPILIYPNPLDPTKYVVLNSGFTFRPPDHRTNSRQIPKLPDYAILDISTPPTHDSPGKVITANFFSESWQLPPSQ